MVALKAVKEGSKKRCVALVLGWFGFCAQLFPHISGGFWREGGLEAEAVEAAAGEAAAAEAAVGRSYLPEPAVSPLPFSVLWSASAADGAGRQAVVGQGRQMPQGQQLKEGGKGRIPFLGKISALERLLRLRDGDWGRERKGRRTTFYPLQTTMLVAVAFIVEFFVLGSFAVKFYPLERKKSLHLIRSGLILSFPI